MEDSRCSYSVARKYPIKRAWVLTSSDIKNTLELQFYWIKPTILINENHEIIAKIYNHKLLSFSRRITLNLNGVRIEGKIQNRFNSVEILAQSNLESFNLIKWKWKVGEFSNQIVLEDTNLGFILAEFKSTPFSYLEVGKTIVPLVFPTELRILIVFTAAYAYRKVLYSERVK
jgi:hypothetical protein